MIAQTFTKKPVHVEAVRWDGYASATKVIDWVIACGGTARYHEQTRPMGSADLTHRFIAVDTPDAVAKVFYGDWVIRGVRGEFYPCQAEIFAATYAPYVEVGSSD